MDNTHVLSMGVFHFFKIVQMIPIVQSIIKEFLFCNISFLFRGWKIVWILQKYRFLIIVSQS